jgi:hypothetical protein
MKLRHSFERPHQHIAKLTADRDALAETALDAYGKDFGASGAQAFLSDLQSQDPEAQRQAFAVLASRSPELVKAQQELDAAVAAQAPLDQELLRRAQDRQELHDQLDQAAALAVPASERAQVGLADAMEYLLDGDEDGGAGRWFARRVDALPAGHPGLDAALDFTSKQPRPVNPLQDASIAELEAHLGTADGAISDTSAAGVLFMPEAPATTVVGAELSLSLEQMRKELESDEGPRLADPEAASRLGHSPRRR